MLWTKQMYNDLSYNSVANNIRAIKLTTKILSYFFFFFFYSWLKASWGQQMCLELTKCAGWWMLWQSENMANPLWWTSLWTPYCADYRYLSSCLCVRVCVVCLLLTSQLEQWLKRSFFNEDSPLWEKVWFGPKDFVKYKKPMDHYTQFILSNSWSILISI